SGVDGCAMAPGRRPEVPRLVSTRSEWGGVRPGPRLVLPVLESAILRGQVDLVLPVEEIGGALVRRARFLRDGRTDDLVPTDEDLARLEALLAADADLDLHGYKRGTLRRRLARRMRLAGLGAAAPYLDLLAHDAAERRALIDDMMIGVTEFFRDDDV